MNKTEMNILGGIFAALLINIGLAVVIRNDLNVLKSEMKTPKRVEITSVGVVHSFPVDNVNTKIVRAD